MESLRKASVRELEAAEEADQFREKARTCKAELLQLRSVQKVATATEPTPIDMAAACSTMQQTMQQLYDTPNLRPIVMESKAAAEGYFVQMAEIAQKLAGFEATVRQAMFAAKAESPPLQAEAARCKTSYSPR